MIEYFRLTTKSGTDFYRHNGYTGEFTKNGAPTTARDYYTAKDELEQKNKELEG